MFSKRTEPRLEGFWLSELMKFRQFLKENRTSLQGLVNAYAERNTAPADGNGGGAAFAAMGRDREGMLAHQPGMTLRDYLAAQAMQGWLASWTPSGPSIPETREALAKSSYDLADAMLKARGKP